MGCNKKEQSKKKPFDLEKEKGIGYEGWLSLGDYQIDYFTGYNYYFWLHKVEALYHFIEDSSRLSTLRPPDGFPKDIDSDELIIENLKMEIHMSVFHSAESLFLTVLGHKIRPELPWFWMTVTGQWKFNNIMSHWQESGLEAIIKEPAEVWLRNALYPTVDKSNENYDRSKRSAIFAKNYLDRLVHEYMKHKEYNAYKHGLKVFPSRKAGRDVLKFLDCEYQPDPEYQYYFKRTSKEYDIQEDMKIIKVNSWLLQNLLEKKRVEFKTPLGQPVNYGYSYFDDFKVEDIFGSEKFEISE